MRIYRNVKRIFLTASGMYLFRGRVLVSRQAELTYSGEECWYHVKRYLPIFGKSASIMSSGTYLFWGRVLVSRQRYLPIFGKNASIMSSGTYLFWGRVVVSRQLVLT